jgi:hypothetical protein
MPQVKNELKINTDTQVLLTAIFRNIPVARRAAEARVSAAGQTGYPEKHRNAGF